MPEFCNPDGKSLADFPLKFELNFVEKFESVTTFLVPNRLSKVVLKSEEANPPNPDNVTPVLRRVAGKSVSDKFPKAVANPASPKPGNVVLRLCR